MVYYKKMDFELFAKIYYCFEFGETVRGNIGKHKDFIPRTSRINRMP
jgi:hypothetical protein